MDHFGKALIIADYLKSRLPKMAIDHKWDPKLRIEWYFIKCKNRNVRMVVPNGLFETLDGHEIKIKLENLRLADCIQNLETEYIMIDKTGMSIETF